MTWNVVIFIKEDTVEAVPKNWFIASSCECFWPPHSLKRDKIFKLIETKVEPDTDWNVYPAKLLGTFDDFKVAQYKAKKAMTSSDISSTNEDAMLNKKRKRRENPKFRYSGSESEIDSDENIYPKKSVLQSMFMQDKSMIRKSKAIKRYRSKSFSPERHNTEKFGSRRASIESLVDNNTEKNQPSAGVSDRNFSYSLGNQGASNCRVKLQQESALSQPLTSASKVDNTAGISSGTSYSAAKSLFDQSVDKAEGNLAIVEKPPYGVSSDNDFKKVVVGELNLLNLKVNAISENVSTLLSIMRQQQGNTVQSEPDVLKKINIFNSKLPLKSAVVIMELEEWLSEDSNYTFMKAEFRRLGGQSLPQAVRKILYKVLSNDVASLYSWDGAKKKAALKNLILARCILDAMKSQYPDSVETDITSVIKIWLVKAKERLSRKPAEADININEAEN